MMARILSAVWIAFLFAICLPACGNEHTLSPESIKINVLKLGITEISMD
jgi:hypothetical protein